MKFILAHSEARQRAMQAVACAPSGWQVLVSPKNRTKEQNSRYWGRGVLAQISEKATVNGKKYSAEVWHEQFKRMFIGVDELPDGSIVGKSSAALNTKEFSEFTDQVEVYAAIELGVVFEDLSMAKHEK